MQKPAVVTGIAYIQFLTIWTTLKTYDTPLIGKAPLYLGSWLSPRAQWTYTAIELLITILVTVGLFLGHNWSRWLLLASALVGWIVAVPVRDGHGVPLYVTSLVFGSIVFYFLFLAPSARAYFSLPRAQKASISLRGFIAGVFYVNGALTLYSLSLYGLVGKAPLWMNLLGLLVVSVPCLLLGMAARWNIVIGLREAATVLIATALFLTFQLLARALSLWLMSPESLPLLNFKAVLSSAVIAGTFGIVLARASVRRSRRQAPDRSEARSMPAPQP